MKNEGLIVALNFFNLGFCFIGAILFKDLIFLFPFFVSGVVLWAFDYKQNDI
jgi:hypothetical protein